MDWLHIDAWLSRMYKETEKVPQFERTRKNYELLSDLVTLDGISFQLVDTLLSVNTEEKTHVSPTSAKEALHYLACLSQGLGLGKTELSNYFTAITKLSLDKIDLNLQENSLDEIEYKIDDCQNVVNNELGHMKDILIKLQQQNHKRILPSDHHLKTTTSEYLSLKTRYNDLNIERKGIRLNHLKELDDKANTLEAELKEKSDLLSSYQVLPSEMVLASIKIQETQDQLHELETEREHLLGDIAKSVI